MARGLGAVAFAERVVVWFAFTVLVCVLFGDVLSRELTGSGLHWSSEVGVFANVFLVMAGFGLATGEGGHLRPRFADRLVPKRFDPVLTRLGYVLTAAFCGVLVWYSLGLVLESFELEDRSLRLHWPLWILQAAFPIAFSLSAIRNLAYAFDVDLAPQPKEATE